MLLSSEPEDGIVYPRKRAGSVNEESIMQQGETHSHSGKLGIAYN